MKAIRLEGLGKLAVRDVAKPVPKPDEILVKVAACGICGTDRHLFLGEFPSRPPVTLGHEFAGTVEAAGAEVAGFRPGMKVTGDPNIACGRCPECHRGRVNLCRDLQAIGIHRDGGFADYVCLPETQAHRLPDDLDLVHGAFCEPLACSIHGLDIAGIRPGESVVVLGGGLIGLLVVQLARLAGASRVVLVTRSAGKRALGERLGATATVDPSAGDAHAAICGESGLLPGGADKVIEAAGVRETVEQAPKLACRGGTVLVLGVLPQGASVAIEPFDLLFREVQLLSSFINPFTHARAADLIASGTIEVEPLITRRVDFEDAAAAIAAPAPAGEIRAMLVPHG
ncbi:zinc-dependent alcohol dehydrogenase family protein [Aureimonas leprariae]|uniref:Zinc-dependent alcohol dehydrogenase family protein n=1 Tax=Plantimonas leprariae TaxID=2615207 RepID=A0A7V7PMQ7_9HYPH|nr:zinc-dependent alcohol dehydrogenase family protein [Aureimonas leprariae]KAB0678550.1 zinc-dependent alcohol dehydrogenase family protein [Aureimonas leprariae]